VSSPSELASAHLSVCLSLQHKKSVLLPELLDLLGESQCEILITIKALLHMYDECLEKWEYLVFIVVLAIGDHAFDDVHVLNGLWLTHIHLPS